VGSSLKVMEKEFIPYEQALALKELGFDEPCFSYYYNRELSFGARTSYGEVLEAPTFSQAFKWFREKYNLLASPKINEFHDRFYFTIKAMEPRLMKEIILKHEINYEEAELECLKKLIEIVNKNLHK
jgi:hypothetical protein